jgi:hypothetical protein
VSILITCANQPSLCDFINLTVFFFLIRFSNFRLTYASLNLWLSVCNLWLSVCNLWLSVCNLWLSVCNLWLSVSLQLLILYLKTGPSFFPFPPDTLFIIIPGSPAINNQ